ncbi:hypothetical protein AAFF_G00413710 [Aldrovandia affinis]|uniref:Secreted protein n=1 Tax=Aldrovandia affinis TaxID=143900 RepID=A0AAD7SBM0_9TELE|nr:hypothetical protein AAFF_G00413710 [Aldrovandia affinis]
MLLGTACLLALSLSPIAFKTALVLFPRCRCCSLQGEAGLSFARELSSGEVRIIWSAHHNRKHLFFFFFGEGKREIERERWLRMGETGILWKTRSLRNTRSNFWRKTSVGSSIRTGRL